MAIALDHHVHRFMPASDSSDTRTILALHGTGGNEHDLIPLAQAVFPGAAVLSPKGNVSENGAARFFRRFGEGNLDLDDLATRTGELADWVGTAASEYGFAASNLIAIGFSNGANVAVNLLFTRPSLLRGAVLLSPMLPYVPEPFELPETAVFIGAGNLDPLVPSQHIDQLQTLLADAGGIVTLHREEIGHTISDREVMAAQEWATLLG
jgi:phospholipase/carboxylesterase